MNSDTKQVIVIRKDLKMRRGKEIAQGCHAAMAFITRRICESYRLNSLGACGACPRKGELGRLIFSSLP